MTAARHSRLRKHRDRQCTPSLKLMTMSDDGGTLLALFAGVVVVTVGAGSIGGATVANEKT